MSFSTVLKNDIMNRHYVCVWFNSLCGRGRLGSNFVQISLTCPHTSGLGQPCVPVTVCLTRDTEKGKALSFYTASVVEKALHQIKTQKAYSKSTSINTNVS